MELTSITKAYLQELGGLHDAIVTKINFDAQEGVLIMSVDDLYSNFEGLPEYKGATSAELIFSGVKEFTSNVDLVGGLHIYDFDITSESDFGGVVTILFWPNGRIRFESATATVKTAG